MIPGSVEFLDNLYRTQLTLTPHDDFLIRHREARFLQGTVQVFHFYLPYLPAAGRILDWGCRHAPDACLIRREIGPQVKLAGCDLVAPGSYRAFFDYAGLEYTQLREGSGLPYENAAFDAVIASGVLEHVVMDYESLKELHRVLKPGGRLIVTYLPNRRSVEEWCIRTRYKSGFHLRTYSLRLIRELFLHTGFVPLTAGYQTRFDLLPADSAAMRLTRPFIRLLQMHRLTSCLCLVAEKVDQF